MSFFAILRVEAGRVLRNRTTWVVAALTLLSALLGYGLYTPAINDTRASQLVANPALAATLCGTVLFALLTIYELDRAYRARAAVLTDAVQSPLMMNVTRLCAVIIAGTLTALLAGLVYLPFTAVRMGNVFDLGDYIACWVILMMLGIWMGCLIAAACYQITRRIDVSVVMLAALVLLSMSNYVRDSFLLRWINPIIPILSDDFSNAQPLAMALYNRLVWLLVYSGLWAASLLCTRRYGKGLLGSLRVNARKAYIPALAVLLVVCGVVASAEQPFVNHAPLDVYEDDFVITEGATLLDTYVDARPNFRLGTHAGTATYRMRNTNSEPVEQKMSINCGYKVKSIHVNGEPVDFTDLNDDLIRAKHILFMLPAEKDLTVVVEYGGYPQMWSISESFMGGDEVNRRYVYLTGDAFAPAMQAERNDDTAVHAEITLPGNLMPLIYGQGETELLSENSDGTKRWALSTNGRTMYLYAADYIVRDVSVPGMAVSFYVSRTHEDVMERMHIDDALRDVMTYCLEHIGPLDFTDEEGRLKLVQMSAFMFGGYAGNGMSVMGESSFVEDTLTDPLRGASGQEVMAHEIIHQWWGLGMMFNEYDGDEPMAWSSEGLTVYSTYRLMKEKYGEAYAQEHYVDVWQQNMDALSRDFYNRYPEYLDRLPEQYAATITGAKQQTLRYCAMPLMILKAEKLVGGEEAMDAILGDLFVRGEDLKVPYMLSMSDFLDACGLTEEDIAL